MEQTTVSREALTLEEMLIQWPELGDPELPEVQVASMVPVVKEEPKPVLKLCADCHWVSAPHNRDVNNYRCFAPDNIRGVHCVDGSRTYWHPLCIDQRINRQTDSATCGPEGNWWKLLVRQAVSSVQVTQYEEPTIGGKTATNLELVSNNSPKKYKVPTLKRLSKSDLDDI